MPETLVGAETIRQVFGDVPELNSPEVFVNTLEHKTVENWPFQVFRLGGERGSERATLETGLHEGSAHIPGSKALVRVLYEESHGLKAKKWMLLQAIDEGKNRRTLLEEGRLSYNLGEVELVLQVYRDSPFAPFQTNLENHQDFKVSVSAISTAGFGQPLAQTVYDVSPSIQIHTQFAYAEYKDATLGNIERPKDEGNFFSSYRNTYFQWEYLVGGKVGYNEFPETGGDRVISYRWLTEVNKQGMTKLESSPYQEKMSWVYAGMGIPYRGRLRFSRVNSDTRESWMFSVPDQMTERAKDGLIGGLQNQSLMDLSFLYPVVFCVKRPGEARKWFSNWLNTDSRG